MLRLFQGKNENVNSQPKTSKIPTACEIRIQKDISELDLPNNMSIKFQNADNLLSFQVSIRPEEGFYKQGQFLFSFKIKETYPYDPPKVLCLQKIYHPNIDLTGSVCLNILREDWKPVLSISSVLYGLQHLFLEPNSEDPLNKEAASVLAINKARYQQNVKMAMRGSIVDGQRYDNVLK